jgi:hypothetical protein
MYSLKSYPKKNEGQSNNRRGSWCQESRGSYRGYRRGGRTGRVFHAERDCHCKRLAKKGAACNICKSENHWSCCCDKRRSREANIIEASYISEDEEQANLFKDMEEHVLIGETRKENEDDKNEWFIDSGASASVAFNKQSFLQYDLLSTPIKIRVGNNTYVEAIGKGTVTFISRIYGVKKVIRLMEVLHVPEIHMSKLSLGITTDKEGSSSYLLR